MQKGSVLILTICSNHKIRGGDPSYDADVSIAESLPPERVADMRRRRCHVYEFIKEGRIEADGRPLAEAPYNARLAAGPDLGGTSAAVYMPAIQRYQGRFYTELGADRRRLAEDSVHHLLIISGLYGLLTPSEPIQGYTCHILHSQKFVETWAGDGAMTSYLLAYARTHGIRRVLDLTGQRAYRNLVNWDRVARRLDVLHAFGEQNAGPDLLPSLGHLALTWLQQDDEAVLLSARDGQSFSTDYEHVTLLSSCEPRAPWAREVEQALPVRAEPQDDDDTIQIGVVEVSADPRDIPVSGGEDTTMFDNKVHSMRDLPKGLRQQMEKISRIVHVTQVFLGRTWSSSSRPNYTIHPSPPAKGTGRIHGFIRGPGKLCHRQDIEIRTTRGREMEVYLGIQQLLNDS